MSEACGQQEQNPWQQDQPYYQKWQDDFACKLSGNWYSTQKVSECKGEPDESCWWKLNSPVRGEVVVNASCVDGRVTKHVRSKHPECWAACGDQADNSSSLCPTSCVNTPFCSSNHCSQCCSGHLGICFELVGLHLRDYCFDVIHQMNHLLGGNVMPLRAAR